MLNTFGAASRRGAPPITLQAACTAGNGQLPPPQGADHHELNTQLSYRRSYSANHLDEQRDSLDWLRKTRPAATAWTRQWFQLPGLSALMTADLNGARIGSWRPDALLPPPQCGCLAFPISIRSSPLTTTSSASTPPPLALGDDAHSAKQTQSASLAELSRLGSDWWAGYSFSSLANLAARTRDGAQAERALKPFATAFCLRNRLPCNGD